jgi:anti-sigma B factor antagonist
MALRVRFAEEDGETVLWVAGELDITVAALMSDALDRVRAVPGRPLTVDLSQLRFLDVSGLRLLIAAGERLRGTGGGLMVRGATGIVRRIFEVMGVTPLLADLQSARARVPVVMPRQVARTG